MDGNALSLPDETGSTNTVIPRPRLADAGRSLSVWPGALIEFDVQGRVVAANDLGAHLARNMTAQASSSISGIVAIVAQSGGSVCDRVEVMFDKNRRWFECVGLPGQDGHVIILARDQTYDFNIRQALFDSRQRYRDLVTISSDFAFETDRTGKFVFVSPHGALGYSPEDLVGRQPRELLLDTDDDDADLPFHTRSGVVQSQIWVRNADGEEACLLASAVPVVDEEGKWSGARGLCRDITHERLRDSQLAQAKVREQVVAYIVNQIREEARPRAMLESAASMLGRATSAAAAVLSYSEDDGWDLSASYGEWPEDVTVETFAHAVSATQETEPFDGPGIRLLARSTWYHGSVNGAVILMREKPRREWSDDERAMLEAVAFQLAIGLRQIADHKELERLSTTDALTGLMNRRAFNSSLEIAMERAERTDSSGVLLFIDLDNFKQINDREGHEVGDTVLRKISDLISARSRKYDLVARLGGDEFAVWLDGIVLGTAKARAAEIIAAMKDIAMKHSQPESPLGASIGLAEYAPGSRESLRELLMRGDHAMYDAKRNGKNRYAAAQAAEVNKSFGQNEPGDGVRTDDERAE